MTIIDAIRDERFFKPLFKDLKTWHNWQVYLKALFGLPIETRNDKKLLKDCKGLDDLLKKPIRESYVIAGRRSGKSFISSILAVYLAAFRDWRKILGPGERGYIFIIANDKQQATIIKNYISGILNSQPAFKKLVNEYTDIVDPC